MKKKIKPKPQKVTWEVPEEQAKNPLEIYPGGPIPEGVWMDTQGSADKPVDYNQTTPENNSVDNLTVVPKPSKTTNSLKDIKDVMPVPMNWSEAEKMALEGKLVRSVNWATDVFLWYRKPYSKPVSGKSGFYKPITKEFLESMGKTNLVIGGHWCRYADGRIIVGYVTPMRDRLDDWEEYTITV